MKNLQASYNEDSNKIVKKAKHKKGAIENLNFTIDLATFAILADDKVTTKKPMTINESWNHFDLESQRECHGVK